MADTSVQISGPAATIVDAASRVLVAIFTNATNVRTTESQAARDEEDHIRFQMFWDWRAILQGLGIVGDKMTWPPVPK